MKKRWIPCIALSLVAVFLAGLWVGADSEQTRFEAARAEGQEIAPLIAVVNSDTGVLVDGARLNYSAAIIETLGDDVVLVSPAMAQNGLASGAYSAVVTFPANVSERILSFNSPNPTRVELEFQVHPSLSEAAYIETNLRVLTMQRNINMTLSNTYISSILSEFHSAQDEIARIFGNDISSLSALTYLQLQAFTASLNMTSVPDIPFNPFEAETAHYLLQMTNFARNISNLYLNSYGDAASAYLAMREGLINLTDGFPEQKFNWLVLLDAWIEISWEYANNVTIYSDDTHAHRMAMDAWHTALSSWLEELEEYQDELEDWEEELFWWLFDTTIEQESWIEYLDSVYEFVQDVEDMRFDLATEFNKALRKINRMVAVLEEHWGDLGSAWGDLEDAWYHLEEEWDIIIKARDDAWEELEDIRGVEWGKIISMLEDEWKELRRARNVARDELEEARDDAWEELLEILNDARGELIDTQSDLSDIIERLVDYVDEYHGAAEELNEFVELLEHFFDSLGEWQEDMTEIEDEFDDIVSHIATWMAFQNQVNDLEQRPYWMQFVRRVPVVCQYCCGLPTGAEEYVFFSHEYATAVQDWLTLVSVVHAPQPIDMSGFWQTMLDLYENLQKLAEDFEFDTIDIDEDCLKIDDIQFPEFEDLLDFELFEFNLTRLKVPRLDIPNLEIPDFDVPEFEAEFEIPDDFTPPEFNRPTLPGTIDSLPLPEDGLPNFPEVTLPPKLPDFYIPSHQRPINDFDGERPERPDLTEPPIPESFWSSLTDMHGQLLSFDVDDFLTDDILRQIGLLLESYESYLDVVRNDLARQFDVNVNVLHGVRQDYLRYLANFRSDANRAEAQEMANLRDLVAIFREIVEGNSEDTQERLELFRSMMPDTRSDAGLNREVVNFAVAPFELVQPVLRAEMEATSEVISPTWLWIALGALAISIVIVAASEAWTAHKNREK